MKYLNIRLKNYGGIMNGLGVEEIIIDFTKCLHNLILIRGDNGSGKSTIFKAIHPLPDPNTSFVPGKQAEKEMTILDGDNIYKILFIHGIKSNGDRDTTKGYITKNGLGLNENGNISSFKDILYAEFNLDSNFVALSQLSSDNRGIADKTPAERKKYVNAILSTLDAYNAIYKTLNKRGSVYKSMINSLTSKLDTIGDLSKLDSIEKDNEQRIQNYTIQKQNLISSIGILQTKLKELDPDNSIREEYEYLKNIRTSLKNELTRMEKSYFGLSEKLGVSKDEDLDKLYNTIELRKDKYSILIETHEKKINSLLNEKQEQSKRLQSKCNLLSSYNSDSTMEQLRSSLEDLTNKIENCKSIFNEINIDIDNNTISKDEYIMALNCLKSIKDQSDKFRSDYEYHIIEKAVDFINTPCSSPEPEEYFIEAIERLYIKISSIDKDISKYSVLADVASKLSMRPNQCKIDTCEFIKDSILASKNNPVQKLKELEEDKELYSSNLKRMSEKRITNKKIWMCMDELNIIIKDILSHKSVLSKLPNGEIYSNCYKMLQLIKTGNVFDDIQKLYSYIEYANVLEEYKVYKNTRDKIVAELQLQNDKIKIIDELNADIDSLNKDIDDIRYEIESSKQELDEARKLFSINSQMIIELSNLIDKKKQYLDALNRFNDIEAKYDLNKQKLSTIPKILDDINETQNNIFSIDGYIKPLENERDKIKHYKLAAKEYSEELKDYKDNYELIEKLKHYSSPNTGIQLVFMDLYMHKVISMANQLLTLLFDGAFVLQPFIINESEFRIPCCGNRIMNDDISSMSTAQICMISMILSFAFLFHSSTKYNILKLDEIDGALDTNNRLSFVNVLKELSKILNTEQVFIISHNDEFDTSEADLIVLKHSHPESICGNIIYKF